MGKRGGKFGRKTVLQLESESKKPTSYGFGYKGDIDKPGSSTLGGLIGPYGNSDESQSENEDDDQTIEKVGIQKQVFVPSSDVTLTPPIVANEESNVAAEQQVVKKSTDVEAKLQDFLAEIDALGGSNDLDGEPMEDQTPDEFETDTDAECDAAPAPPRPVEPTTSWQHTLDEGTQYYYYWNVTTNEVTWKIPEGYSQYLLLYKEYEAKLTKYEKDLKQWEEEQKNKPKPKARRKKLKTTAKPVVLNSNGTNESSGQIQADQAMTKPTSVGKPAEKNDSSNLIGHSVLTNNTVTAVNERAAGVLKETDTAKVQDQEEDIDDDYVYRQLEEPVAENYTQTNKKHPQSRGISNQVSQDSNNLDIDIDSELDSALALKQMKIPEVKNESVKGGVKRTLPDATASQPQLKKQKHVKAHEDSYIDKEYLNNKVSLLTEASELSQLVADKLQFLDVSRVGLSKLQVLLIEMQTRIGDWKCGGLSTDYLLQQMRAADLDLQCYETSAAPKGWQCCWHSEYKRYYYSHVASGAWQWDYPEADDSISSQSERLKVEDQSEQVIQNGSSANDNQLILSSGMDTDNTQEQGKTNLDYTSLAGAPPPPPPVTHRTKSPPPATNHTPPSPPPVQKGAAGAEKGCAEATERIGLVDYSYETTQSADEEVASADDGGSGGAQSADTSPQGHAAKVKVTAAAAEQMDEMSGSDQSPEADEPPPPGTETELLPVPLPPKKDQGLTGLINYEDSDSAHSPKVSEHRSKSAKRRRSKKRSRRRRRRRSTSSSSSGDRTRRRFRSDSSDGELQNDVQPSAVGDVTPSERQEVGSREEVVGEVVGGEQKIVKLVEEDDNINITKEIVNSLQKPVHFAAAPILVRPPTAAVAENADVDGIVEANKTDDDVTDLKPEVTQQEEEKRTAHAKEKSDGTREKRKRKEKSISGGGLSMKKKGVNNLVQKWQKVQKEVEKDTKHSSHPPPPDI